MSLFKVKKPEKTDEQKEIERLRKLVLLAAGADTTTVKKKSLSKDFSKFMWHVANVFFGLFLLWLVTSGIAINWLYIFTMSSNFLMI